MRKHLTYFKRMSDHREMISNGIEQTEWVRLTEAERSNIRLSIQWAVENDPGEASDFINNISEFWNIKGYFSEGLKTCLSILDKNFALSDLNRATNLYNTGLMSNYLGKIAEADRYGKEALSIFRNLNNKERMATCLILLGANLSYNQSVSDEILEYYNEALLITRELNLKNELSQVMYNISFVQSRKGDHEAALKSKLEALNISKETGNTHQITLTLASLGVSEFRKENFEIARTYSEESLALSHELGDKNLISINLTNLGCIYSGLKNFEKALSLLNESIIIYKECGYKTNMIPALYYLGDVVANLGDHGKAIKHYKESIQTGSDLGIDFFLNLNFYGLGITYFNIDDFENSVKYFSFMEMFDEKYNGSLGKLKMENGLSYLKKLNEILGNATFEKYRKEILHMNKDEMISFALERRS